MTTNFTQLQNATFLDLDSYRTNLETPPTGQDPKKPVTLYAALVLGRANGADPTTLLDDSWGSRQQQIATMVANNTLWSTYGADPDDYKKAVKALKDLGIDEVGQPNGLCFSPDYKKLYVASTGKGPGDTGAGGKGDMFVFDVGSDNKLSNHKRFSDFMVDGVKCGPDGMRCDVNGNVWAASNAGRAVGYSGVTVWSPEGKLLGRIRLPEVCGNVTFGGPKRNRLFMAASQSLYAVYTATQGAGPG